MSRYTILSLNPPSKGGLANMDLKVHGHCVGVYETSLALDEFVCSFIEEQNKKHNLNSDRRFSSLNQEWEMFENCFYAVVTPEEFTGIETAQDDDNNSGVEENTPKVVTVWEKYAKPGRIYGETPRRRKIRLFVSLLDEPSKDDEIPRDISPAKTINSSVSGVGGGGVTFDQVIDELKEKLSQRANRIEDNSNHPAKVKRLSQVQKLDQLDLEECFPKVSPPQFLKTTVLKTENSSSDSDPLLKKYVHVHINPLWQGERDNIPHAPPPSPPTYEQVINLSEKYSIHNRPESDSDQNESWSDNEENDESVTTELISSEISSSVDEYYQRVERGVVTYLAPRRLSAYSESPMDTESEYEISDESAESEHGSFYSEEDNDNEKPAEFGHHSWPELNPPHRQTSTSFWNVNHYDDVFTPLLTDEEQKAYKLDDDVANVTIDGATDWLYAYQKIINDWRVSRGLPVEYEFYIDNNSRTTKTIPEDLLSSSSELSSSSSSEVYISTRGS
jgi:hypothetical protein